MDVKSQTFHRVVNSWAQGGKGRAGGGLGYLATSLIDVTKMERQQKLLTRLVMLGADHLIPGGGGGGLWFFVKKKIVQQILENK